MKTLLIGLLILAGGPAMGGSDFFATLNWKCTVVNQTEATEELNELLVYNTEKTEQDSFTLERGRVLIAGLTMVKGEISQSADAGFTYKVAWNNAAGVYRSLQIRKDRSALLYVPSYSGPAQLKAQNIEMNCKEIQLSHHATE